MKRSSVPVRATVDTNIIVSGLISTAAAPYELVQALRAGAFTLVISEPLRAEYVRVLHRPHFGSKYGLTQDQVAAFLALVDTNADVIPASQSPIAVRDHKDERVLAAALAGGADFLVTGDEDLLCLHDDPRIAPLRIVTAREFLEFLESL